jgi:hypothetical protein
MENVFHASECYGSIVTRIRTVHFVNDVTPRYNQFL